MLVMLTDQIWWFVLEQVSVWWSRVVCMCSFIHSFTQQIFSEPFLLPFFVENSTFAWSISYRSPFPMWLLMCYDYSAVDEKALSIYPQRCPY